MHFGSQNMTSTDISTFYALMRPFGNFAPKSDFFWSIYSTIRIGRFPSFFLGRFPSSLGCITFIPSLISISLKWIPNSASCLSKLKCTTSFQRKYVSDSVEKHFKMLIALVAVTAWMPSEINCRNVNSPTHFLQGVRYFMKLSV